MFGYSSYVRNCSNDSFKICSANSQNRLVEVLQKVEKKEINTQLFDRNLGFVKSGKEFIEILDCILLNR